MREDCIAVYACGHTEEDDTTMNVGETSWCQTCHQSQVIVDRTKKATPEKAKDIMLSILIDLTFVKRDLDISEVGPILQKNLGLNETDMKEVMGLYRGYFREAYESHPDYPGSRLESTLKQS